MFRLFLCFHLFGGLFLVGHNTLAVPEHHGDGNKRKHTGTNPPQIVHTLIDNPTEERRGEIKCTGLEALGNLGSRIAGLRIHGLGSLRGSTITKT